MATTKRARYKFAVKESAPDPFIMLEPAGREPEAERPLQGPNFASFNLKPGISFDEAWRIADFLNDNLQFFAVTTFGDVEDTARDVTHSEHRRGGESKRFSLVLEGLKEALVAGNLSSALDAMKAVESVAADLVEEWGKALAMSQDILNAFGKRDSGTTV